MKNIKILGTLMTTHGYTNDSISLADVPASRRDNKGNIKPHCLPKLPIPTHSDSDSDLIRTPIPTHSDGPDLLA